MRAALGDCSGEDVFYDVLGYLPTDDLRTLCLVSNGTRSFVQPLIYRNIDITWGHGKASCFVLLT